VIQLVIAAVLMAIGFASGWKTNEWRHSAEQLEATRIIAQQKLKIAEADRKAEKPFADRRAARAAEREAVNKEVIQHAAIPDPVQCHLADERVSTINRAWGLLGDDQRGQVGLVPGPGTTGVRLPSGAGAVGSGTGLQVPGVR
jgi:hypothetical protein